MLGDIIISVDKVKEQDKKLWHSEKREYAFFNPSQYASFIWI